jgi:hypothetical protein
MVVLNFKLSYALIQQFIFRFLVHTRHNKMALLNESIVMY